VFVKVPKHSAFLRVDWIAEFSSDGEKEDAVLTVNMKDQSEYTYDGVTAEQLAEAIKFES
jgi:hypothetical protein